MLKNKYVKGNEMILSLLLRFIALFCKKKNSEYYVSFGFVLFSISTFTYLIFPLPWLNAPPGYRQRIIAPRRLRELTQYVNHTKCNMITLPFLCDWCSCCFEFRRLWLIFLSSLFSFSVVTNEWAVFGIKSNRIRIDRNQKTFPTAELFW